MAFKDAIGAFLTTIHKRLCFEEGIKGLYEAGWLAWARSELAETSFVESCQPDSLRQLDRVCLSVLGDREAIC